MMSLSYPCAHWALSCSEAGTHSDDDASFDESIKGINKTLTNSTYPYLLRDYISMISHNLPSLKV